MTLITPLPVILSVFLRNPPCICHQKPDPKTLFVSYSDNPRPLRHAAAARTTAASAAAAAACGVAHPTVGADAGPVDCEPYEEQDDEHYYYYYENHQVAGETHFWFLFGGVCVYGGGGGG